MKNTTQIIKRSQRDTQMPKNTIRRRHMKVEVWNRILRQILLATRKPKSPHLSRLHNNLLLCQLLEIQGSRIDGFEDGDCGFDAGLQFGEGGFVVCEADVWKGEHSHGEPFGGVGEGLDLVWETEGVSLISCIGLGESGLTASCRRANGMSGYPRA